jgi:hypothetical protein
MKITRPLLLAALVALLVTAGCARDGGATDSTQPGGVPAGSASPDLPTSSDLPAPSKGGEPGATGALTVTGTVAKGVEPGCLLLSAGGQSHLLIFDDAALKAQATEGATLVVTGRSDPSMMTTCQQGTPFVVTAVRPA